MSYIVIAAVVILMIVVISLLPSSINNKHRKKQANELAVRFTELGERNNLSFKNKVGLKHSIIGLDDLRKKLFILTRTDNKYDLQVIDLKEIINCSIIKLYKRSNMVTDKKQRYEFQIDSIALEIDYANKREPVQIPFYRSGLDHLTEMTGLEQKATNWEIILTKAINNHSMINAT